MESIEQKKERIGNYHINKINDINSEILKLTSNAMRDKRIKTGFSVKVSDRIHTMGLFYYDKKYKRTDNRAQ